MVAASKELQSLASLYASLSTLDQEERFFRSLFQQYASPFSDAVDPNDRKAVVTSVSFVVACLFDKFLRHMEEFVKLLQAYSFNASGSHVPGSILVGRASYGNMASVFLRYPLLKEAYGLLRSLFESICLSLWQYRLGNDVKTSALWYENIIQPPLSQIGNEDANDLRDVFRAASLNDDMRDTLLRTVFPCVGGVDSKGAKEKTLTHELRRLRLFTKALGMFNVLFLAKWAPLGKDGHFVVPNKNSDKFVPCSSTRHVLHYVRNLATTLLFTILMKPDQSSFHVRVGGEELTFDSCHQLLQALVLNNIDEVRASLGKKKMKKDGEALSLEAVRVANLIRAVYKDTKGKLDFDSLELKFLKTLAVGSASFKFSWHRHKSELPPYVASFGSEENEKMTSEISKFYLFMANLSQSDEKKMSFRKAATLVLQKWYQYQLSRKNEEEESDECVCIRHLQFVSSKLGIPPDSTSAAFFSLWYEPFSENLLWFGAQTCASRMDEVKFASPENSADDEEDMKISGGVCINDFFKLLQQLLDQRRNGSKNVWPACLPSATAGLLQKLCRLFEELLKARNQMEEECDEKPSSPIAQTQNTNRNRGKCKKKKKAKKGKIPNKDKNDKRESHNDQGSPSPPLPLSISPSLPLPLTFCTNTC